MRTARRLLPFVQDLDTVFAVREEGVRAEIQSIAAQLRNETERYREFMWFISEIRARVTQMRRSPSEFRNLGSRP